MSKERVEAAEKRAEEMVKDHAQRLERAQEIQRKLKPLRDNIFIRVIDESETVMNGIVIPDVAKKKQQEGIIVAMGRGYVTDDGKVVAPEVKVGDHVLMPMYGGTQVEIDKIQYVVFKEKDLMSIIM